MEIKRIILGSQSPRRREYIQYLGYPVETLSPNVDEESYPPELPLNQVPEFLAELKASSLNLDLQEGEVLITSDTIVILENEILGKPENPEHAVELLKKLSGKTHEVVSGVYLKSKYNSLKISASTLVTFSELSGEIIQKYVDEYQPLDKAGAYGIQEHIGYVGVREIQGSYMNVIGFPLAQIKDALDSF
jgi:septum formation protein